MRDLRNRAAVGLLLVALLLGATACFQADVGLEVADDGSGQLVLDVFPSPQLLATVGGNLDAFATQLQKAATAQSPGVVVRVDDRPEGQALHIELPFTDVEALTSDAGAGTGGVTGSLLGGVVQRLQVSHTGDTWSMVAVIDPRATQGGLLGSPLAQNPDLRIYPTVFFHVTLPGKITSTNAPSSKGGTARWTVRTTGTSPQTFRMVTKSVNVLPYVLSILVPIFLLALLAIALTRWRRRRVQAALQEEVRAAAAANVAVSPAVAAWGPGPAAAGQVTAGPSTPAEVERAAAPAGEPGPVPGWYPDPAGSGRLRWWDGSGWTEHLHDPPG